MKAGIYQPGERLGSYEVLALEAEGRASALYVARDLEPEGEREDAAPVVLKASRFDPASLSRELQTRHNARLEREFSLLEPLWHRNVVRAFERQYHAGLAFYAMERLEGPTLGRWWTEERRSFLESMLVLRQLASGLAYLHERGVVHGNLKPSHVVLVKPGRTPPGELEHGDEDEPEERDDAPFPERAMVQPVLIDFDLATDLEGDAERRVEPLRGTAELMTPDYARAVLEGTKYRARPDEDVFQFGVLLYVALTGRFPTETDGDLPRELMDEVANVMPKDPRAVNAEAPPALARLAMECLAKRGADRPSDGAELARRLSQAMKADAAELERPGPEYRARKGTPLPEQLEATVEGEVPGPRRKRRTRGGRTPALAKALATVLLEEGRGNKSKQRQLAKVLRVLKALTLGNGLMLVGLFVLMILVVTLARELAQSTARLADASAELSHAVVSMTVGVQAPVVRAAEGGLKMPDKPKPDWLRCPDLCGWFGHPSCTENGEPIHAIGLQGSCWMNFANPFHGRIPPENKPCPDGYYDPPPEAPADLKDSCFKPYIASPPRRAAEPTPGK